MPSNRMVPSLPGAHGAVPRRGRLRLAAPGRLQPVARLAIFIDTLSPTLCACVTTWQKITPFVHHELVLIPIMLDSPDPVRRAGPIES